MENREIQEQHPEIENRLPERRERKNDCKQAEKQKTILSCMHDVVFFIVPLLFVFVFMFRVVVVSGPSMKNTLVSGDFLLVLNQTFYHKPKHGDIIVASKDNFKNGEPIIKRVIATEGQTVDIDFENGIVYVDGVALEERYTATPTNEEEGMTFPLMVEDNCIFVMGDNRNSSKDSRNPDIGLVDKREVLGKAIFLIYPGRGDTYDRVKFDLGRIGVP